MIRKCACCAGKEINLIWNLPKLPLTGIYFEDKSDPNFEYLHDQQLAFCNQCTHMQLNNIVDPTLLYHKTYTHRTSTSNISRSGNDFLLNLILNKKFKDKKQILEIGCNDTYLLNNLREVTVNRAGMDPIFDEARVKIDEGLYVHGGFAETFNYGKLVEDPVDLVISAHTFEHVVDPIASIQNLSTVLGEKVDFIIEVPSSLRMIEQLRLDQVFSQHINYYSPESLSRLMSKLDLNLVDITYNYSYWGGTQILHFSNYIKPTLKPPVFNLSLEKVKRSIELFVSEKEKLIFRLENSPGRVFAYGAAQMFPILQYHFSDSFKRVEEIFDDNPDRVGKYFPGDDRKIRSFNDFKFEPNDTVVITALDSTKPLIRNLISRDINLIIIPLGNV